MADDPKCVWCDIPCSSAENWESFCEEAPGEIRAVLQRLYPEARQGVGTICAGCSSALVKGITIGISYARADLLDIQANASLTDPMTGFKRW